MARLARLLRQRQAGGCPCRDRDRAGGAAHRPGHPWQGLGRDAAPLSGPGGGRADQRADAVGLGAAWPGPPAQGAQGRLPVELAPALRRGLAATGLLLAMQLLAGGWVSTNYAVLA